jgi:hypothetical protein
MARPKQPNAPTPKARTTMERRQFLRTGGLAGAAALVAPTDLVGAQLPPAPPRPRGRRS